MSIKAHKESDGLWMVWDTETKDYAWIAHMREYNAISKPPVRYKVEVSGVTIETYIDNWNTAKSIASKAIRERKGSLL